MSTGSAAGRPRKPLALHLLEGTQRLDRMPEAEPVLQAPIDTPAPAHLTPSQKELWDHGIKHAPIGMIGTADKQTLLSWVVAADEVNDAETHLREEGRMLETDAEELETIRPDGTRIIRRICAKRGPNPWAAFRDKAFQRMMKATSELGFSPVSRTRISLKALAPKKEAEDPANRFGRNAAAAKARA